MWETDAEGRPFAAVKRAIAEYVGGQPSEICLTANTTTALAMAVSGGCCLAAGALCFPSSWSLAEKFGRPLDYIVEPEVVVDGCGQTLAAGSRCTMGIQK